MNQLVSPAWLLQRYLLHFMFDLIYRNRIMLDGFIHFLTLMCCRFQDVLQSRERQGLRSSLIAHCHLSTTVYPSHKLQLVEFVASSSLSSTSPSLSLFSSLAPGHWQLPIWTYIFLSAAGPATYVLPHRVALSWGCPEIK